MDDKLENALDEIVWSVLQTLKNKDIEPYDASIVLGKIGELAQYGEFETLYDQFSWQGQNDPHFKEFVRYTVNL